MLRTFYDSGEVDASLYAHQALDFHVGLGWPGLAKVLLGIALLAIVLVAALVFLVVWLVRRRRADQASS
jgi:hypothetical protein